MLQCSAKLHSLNVSTYSVLIFKAFDNHQNFCRIVKIFFLKNLFFFFLILFMAHKSKKYLRMLYSLHPI